MLLLEPGGIGDLAEEQAEMMVVGGQTLQLRDLVVTLPRLSDQVADPFGKASMSPSLACTRSVTA